MTEPRTRTASEWRDFITGCLDFRPPEGIYRIAREMFTEPELFSLEMEFIFEKTWIYACHESEIPNKNEERRRRIVRCARKEDIGLQMRRRGDVVSDPAEADFCGTEHDVTVDDVVRIGVGAIVERRSRTRAATQYIVGRRDTEARGVIREQRRILPACKHIARHLSGAVGQDLVDIVIGRLASGYGSDQYAQVQLREDHPLFLARQGHPLTQRPVTLEDLLGFPWVLPEQPNIIRQQLEFAVRNRGLGSGADIMSSQVSPLTFRLASKSDTLVLASQCIADELHALYRLQPVLCELQLHLGPLVAVTRRDKPASRAASAFLQQLLGAMA